MRKLEDWGYQLCWELGWRKWIGRLWAPIWYRWYCPYPVIENRPGESWFAGTI